MAYQLDVEKGILEIDLGNITSYDFIEEGNMILRELKNVINKNYNKFEITLKGIDLVHQHDESVLFMLLVNILSEIEMLSKNKFPVTIFWNYKNDKELEIGNIMNDLHDEHMKFEFIKVI